MKLVVLLHGYGSNAADLRGLAVPWKKDGCEFIAIDAPTLVAGYGPGYEWFTLEGWMPGTPFTQFVHRVEDAAATLKTKIKTELKTRGLSWKDLVLMGFSQGAIMALAVGLSEPEQCAGVMAYSGAYLTPVPPESKPPVLLVHGGMDNVVSPEAYHEAKKLLEDYAVPLTAKFIPSCGHWIDPVGLQAGVEFLKAL